MQFKWTDHKDRSHLSLAHWLKGSGLATFVADVAQPTGKRNNWHAQISASMGGKSLSLESGKIDAVMALRRLVVKLAEALGGTVVWTIKEECHAEEEEQDVRADSARKVACRSAVRSAPLRGRY